MPTCYQTPRRFIGSFKIAQIAQNFFQNRFIQAAVTAVPPSLAYLVLVESAKFHLIQFYRKNASKVNAETRSRVEQAYQNMGCEDKTIYFCDAGFKFPYTLTTLIDPRLVLFSYPQSAAPQDYDELYAMAGHEALHAKENHALKSEFAFFMTMELMREMSVIFLRLRATVAFWSSFACAVVVFNQVNKALEYRADAVSAKTLHTAPELCRLFHRHFRESSPSYPSFESREANLKKLGC